MDAERRAEWDATFISNLPDSAFAYIEPGGEKDDEGKTTPRLLRHFPHHGPDGDIDLPHLRNALSRGPQSGVWPKGKGHLEAHAEAGGVGDRGAKPMKMGAVLGPERRYIVMTDVEVRSEDQALRFSGHAAVYNSRTYIGPKPYGFWEEVRAGAFAKTITEGDVRMLHNHNPDLVLARSTVHEGPGSLALNEEKRGLHAKAEWVPTTYAQDLALSLRHGTVSQMSFSFTPVKEEWTKDDKGEDVRSLGEVSLYDVSTVTFPAYTETDAAMRAVGLDGILRYADVSEEDRLRFFSAIRTGLITPDLAPALRAASQALVELAQKYEPATPTRAQDEIDLSTEQVRLRFRALAAMSADWTKGVRT